jgi:hypothetical protein
LVSRFGIATPHRGVSARSARSSIEALIDLYLLADCQWLVVDRSSSFSRLAKLLSMAPAARVLDVGAGKGSMVWSHRIWAAKLRLGVFTWGLRLFSRLVPVRKL